MNLWYVANLVLCALGCGLILFVRTVHYPLFKRVGRDAFVDYERVHMKRTGFVAGPLMLVDLVVAHASWVLAEGFGGSPSFLASVLLLWLVWAITGFRMVGLHTRLAGGFDPVVWGKLLWWDSWRAGFWWLRLGALLVFGDEIDKA